MSQRKACEKYGLKRRTIRDRLKNKSITDDKMQRQRKTSYSSKYTVSQVFTTEQEKLLTDYLIKCSKMHYGLSMIQTRKLAYEYAKEMKNHYPPSWDEKGMAGEDWLLGFRKRNSTLSLRKAENTSVARSSAFNRTNVNNFYSNLQQVLTKNSFSPYRIINCDETGIFTVMDGPKILTDKNVKQVGLSASRERGELTTMCGIISAAGHAFPPVFIFLRTRYKSCFLNNA